VAIRRLHQTTWNAFCGGVVESTATPTSSWVTTSCDLVISSKTVEANPIHLSQVERATLLSTGITVQLRCCARLWVLDLHYMSTLLASSKLPHISRITESSGQRCTPSSLAASHTDGEGFLCMRACISVVTEDGSGGASCEPAHRGHRRHRRCAWAKEGGVGTPGRQTLEGRHHGHPPRNYGGSRPSGDGHEPTHPAKRRRPAATKLVEGEPPQLKLLLLETTTAARSSSYDRGELRWLQLRAERSPRRRPQKWGATITPTAYNSTTMKST
jgi:hypothetical protein